MFLKSKSLEAILQGQHCLLKGLAGAFAFLELASSRAWRFLFYQKHTQKKKKKNMPRTVKAPLQVVAGHLFLT